MFKKGMEQESAWGVSDPMKRRFLAGFFVGVVVGMGISRLLGMLGS